jgi:hypothetical protein
MKALLLFHLVVGVRVAVRSFAPLFCAILIAIMFNMYPAALVVHLALSLFVPRPALTDLLPVIVISFLLPAWAAPRLTLGLNGWMRHLALSSKRNRRGLAMSLVVVQMPLAVSLMILALVAHAHGRPVAGSLIRYLLLFLAAGVASLPVIRRWITAPLALAAAACSLFGNWWLVAGGGLLLLLADPACGPIRQPSRRRNLRAVGSSFAFRLSWRALRWRTPTAYALPLLTLGATALFAANNELTGPLLAGTVRFGGAMASAFCMAFLASRLSALRPVWPWSRSLPMSSMHRIANDAVFLGMHALPLLIPTALLEPSSALFVLMLLPLFAVRAAGFIRSQDNGRAGTGRYLLETFFISSMTALLPWAGPVAFLSTVPALASARQSETRQKVTRWVELHHRAVGDSLSWSDQ